MSEEGDILSGLTPEQQEAVTHADGPLLVVAGAGSGKTRVITRRVAWLVHEAQVAPYSILAITFTNKAAAEMRERIATWVDSPRMWIHTFHAACARILRRDIDKLSPYTPEFTISDESDCISLIRDLCDEVGVDTKEMKPSMVREAISRFKCSREDESLLYSTRLLPDKVFLKIYERYKQVLREGNILDFDDLLLKVVELFEKEREILDRYRKRFEHVVVDEYQDTNHIQYLLLKLLCAPNRNICATGDPDQSIYGWRGADLNNIMSFRQDFAGAKMVTLARNFRSTNNILRMANRLISVNSNRYHKELHSDLGEGEPPTLVLASGEREEASSVLSRIRSLVGSGYARYGECAILYRVNAQSRPFEEVCRTFGIPYTIVGSVEFFKRKVIRDIVAYMKLLQNPSDSMSLFRIINSPPRGIGPTTVARVKEFAQASGLTPMEVLTDKYVVQGMGKRSASALEGFTGVLDRLRSFPTKPVAPLLNAILDETGYRKSYESSIERTDQEALENIQALCADASEFDSSIGGDLREYLERVALVSDTDSLDEASGAVTLMTLHSAKGLEFQHVFISGLEEGLLPHERSKSDDQLEEERRLFYVGITRAQRNLAVSYSDRRFIMGTEKYVEPSRFLRESGLLTTGARKFVGGGPSVTSQPVEAPRRDGFSIESFTKKIADLAGRKQEQQPDVVASERSGLVSSESSAFTQGDVVEHDQFGPGRIEEISGSGPSRRVRIFFRHYGLKVFQYDMVAKRLTLKRRK